MSKEKKKKKINSKKKGNRNELEFVKILNSTIGEGKNIFSRTPSSGAWGGGENRERREDMNIEAKISLVSDVITPIDFKFVLEHKAYNNVSFWDLFNKSSNFIDWTKQVESDAEFVNKLPMLIMKFDRKKRIVFIKDKFDYYIFEWNGWHCYWLNDLLEKQPKDYWFERNK